MDAAPRPTSELAADVRAGLVRAFDPDAKLRLPNPAALAALSALVARITDLEAQVASWQASCEAARQDFENIYADREAYIANAAGNARRAAAAEAQVAALTQERDRARASRDQWQREAEGRGRVQYELLARAEAAEAALATTRQALTEIRDTIVPYPYSPQFLKDIARRALAATSTTNAT